MAKIGTLFMTQTAEKPYSLGQFEAAHTYIAHIKGTAPGWLKFLSTRLFPCRTWSVPTVEQPLFVWTKTDF